ncbi:hypothetical protein CJ030_MR4G026973 [Morella rubra]|uniref:Uncharacterized protein n=1 Tax=Morella rubra TaxID=262757 RepID=A0A6A1VT53_9ROSI|nr:hypothetical protein CJ030_MR4G026973 [Morella rubra]
MRRTRRSGRGSALLQFIMQQFAVFLRGLEATCPSLNPMINSLPHHSIIEKTKESAKYWCTINLNQLVVDTQRRHGIFVHPGKSMKQSTFTAQKKHL